VSQPKLCCVFCLYDFQVGAWSLHVLSLTCSVTKATQVVLVFDGDYHVLIVKCRKLKSVRSCRSVRNWLREEISET